MNWLSRFFLHAKHWQMFLLFFVCIVGQFAGPIAIISAAPSPGALWRAQIVGIALAAISEIVFLSWLWFIGSFLCSVVQPRLKPSESFFRIAIIYPLVFGLVELAFIVRADPRPFGVIVPLALVAFVCLIYDLNFVAKALALAEVGKSRVFGDFALLWFFPIGVWFIQPRVNRLYNARGNLSPSVE
jgi:hypothetical protein